jgi:ubiquinone/menaquinone biosynthesis C-methylase UbiE
VTTGVLDAAELQPGHRVLDVGCGQGDVTLLAARLVGPRGLALGMDESAPMIVRARRRASEAGLANVGFLHGETRTLRLSPLRFDVIVSQIALTSFAELARALRPGGRLVLVSVDPDRVDAELRRAGLVQWASARVETERTRPWLVTAAAPG